MDLRTYYRKIRETEEGLGEGASLIVSIETPDGGRAGVKSEVPRRAAAVMIVEGKARLGSDEERSRYQAEKAQAIEAAAELAAASRVRVALLSEAELRQIKGQGRPAK